MAIKVGFEPHLESINTAFRKYFSDHRSDVELTVLKKPMRKNRGPFFVFQAVWFRIASIVSFIKDYDLIHVNSAKFGIVAYIASFFGCRYIYTIHATLAKDNSAGLAERIYLFIEAKLLKLVAQRALCVTAVSSYCSDEIFQRFSVRSLVLYNGYDDAFFTPTDRQADIKEMLGLANKLVFISVGRITQEKQPLNVVRFFYRIRQQHPEAYLLLIGNGNMVERVKQEIVLFKLQNDVSLVTHVPFTTLPDYYRAADYFISACEVEAFGLVALEALGCGAAPLVPWKGAFPEIFKNTSFSYNVDDVQHTIPAKEELLKYRENILDRFKWNDKVALYHQLYLKMVTTSGSSN